MPAEPSILIYHGPDDTTPENFTGLEARFKRADNSTADLDNPIPVPSTGINYSFPKHTKVSWSPGPQTLIRNLVWFINALDSVTDPALNWDGMTLYAGVVPNYIQGVSADASALRSGMTDSINTTIATPMDVNTGTVLTSTETGTGTTQQFVLLQLAVLPAALSGVKGRRDAYYRYEEI